MKLLDRYIGLSVIKGYVLVMAVLASIFSFLALVEQLEDVGDGSFGTLDAIVHVLLTLPQRMLDLAPVTVLLGSLVALGSLAKNSELIAIRAGGASMKKIGTSIIKPAVALMIFMYLFLQYVAPPLQQSAEKRRAAAVSASGDLLTGIGLWSRDGRKFINVRNMLHGRIPSNINIYEFSADGSLQQYIHADHAEIQDTNQWILIDVELKNVSSDGIVEQRVARSALDEHWPKPALPFKQLSKESLSLSGLYNYVSFLRSTNQKSDETELLLWQRSLLPISAVTMALLAVPFGFGLLRSTNFAKRLTLGATVGVTFYLANQIIASVGLLTGSNPLLVALTPIIIVAVTALLLLRRRF